VWVRPVWAAVLKKRGLWTALGGGLVGAWLGFSSAAGPLSLITTIIGAAIIANMALIILSIYWDRSTPDRVTTATKRIQAISSTSIPLNMCRRVRLGTGDMAHVRRSGATAEPARRRTILLLCAWVLELDFLTRRG
jgi:hypothetical protein